MSRALKVLMLSSVSVVVALGAVAQDTSLEDRIAALEAMVSELKTELATERANREEDVVRIERTVTEAPAAAPAPKTDGFLVGDTTPHVRWETTL